MSTSKQRAVLTSLVAAIAAVVSVPVAAAPEQQQQPKTDPMAFVRGAKAWSDNCMRCHNMRDPKDYRDDQWATVMQHMRLRAGLTGQETRDILKFLQGSN